MGVLAWAMMGIAVWHFTILVPDRFWNGIVGSFVFAMAGAIVSGFVISGFSVPNNDELTLATPLMAIPGALAGMAIAYLIGVRQGNEALHL
jgi:uncharacterized membrane protein YeaQ/YmgE (transglycosylase-associated protein family)